MAHASLTSDETIMVVFTPEELQAMRELASARVGVKLEHGVVATKGTFFTEDETKAVSKQAQLWAMQFKAVRAERAVCEAFGFEQDRTVSIEGHRRGNILLPDGRRANAKLTPGRSKDYALKSDRLSDFYGDLGFLCWPVGRKPYHTEIMGWLDRATFEKKCWRTDRYYVGYRLVVSRRDLLLMTQFPFSLPPLELEPAQAALL